MKKTPLSRMTERFESKEKLIAAVQGLANDGLFLDRLNPIKGLAKVSNAKLLRLHDVLGRVKKDFGSRDALVSAVLVLENRVKDEGYKARLGRFPTPQLLDHHSAAVRRAKRAAAAKPPSPVKKVARSKVAKAKPAR